MAARIVKELEEARRWGGARDLRLQDGDVLRWTGLLLPNNPPYNAGAFRFKLTFSPHHPLVPPPRHPLHPHLPSQRGHRRPRLSAPHLRPALGAHHPRHPSAAGPAAAAGQPRPPAGAAAGSGP
ncbi:hypothetical protein Q9966_013450 [Columba livia]|nr:hypothetical protein Q9966_013450 [Columba livia]